MKYRLIKQLFINYYSFSRVLYIKAIALPSKIMKNGFKNKYNARGEVTTINIPGNAIAIGPIAGDIINPKAKPINAKKRNVVEVIPSNSTIHPV